MAIYQILELLLTTRLDLGHIQPFLLLNKLFHNHCPVYNRNSIIIIHRSFKFAST